MNVTTGALSKGQAEDATLYVRNMVALWRWDVPLALAVEAIGEECLPKPEPAKDGGWTVRVGGGGSGGGVYLHSRYRPMEEAQRWAATWDAAGKYVVVISGFGLGHHVKAVFEKLPPDGILIIAEPDVTLIALALRLYDFSEMLGSGRVYIFTSLDRSAIVDRLEPRSPLLLGDAGRPGDKDETDRAGVVLAVHQPSLQIARDFHLGFQKIFTEFVAFTRTGFVTLMVNNVATCRNITNNIGRYVTTPPLEELENVYKGRPAILVAAGPSLAKNMHLLHEVKDGGAVVIAVQTMLKPLLAAGLEPEFVTSLDYNTVSTRFFENLDEAGATGKVHLVAEPKANWNVLDVFDGTMSLLGNEFADKLIKGMDAGAGDGSNRKSLRPGATVAHLSFYLAEFLGCNPIILIGQDLGFVDGLYYKPGTAIHETWGVEMSRFNSLETKEWERIVRSRPILRKIPDIHGHPMYTEEQFFVYLQQFERDFSASPAQIIDATEGGARKQHVTLMTLREAIDKYCKNSASAFFRPWKQWQCDRLARLHDAHAAIERRRAAALAMQDTCLQTIPLLEEMLTSQTDDKRMRELFIEVDRHRGKVGQDQDTFEMVCHLNTIGEMRRYRHDLAVKATKENTLERQKRQLERDIDYVKNLQVGAERLLEVLDEGLTRLQRQIAALEAGRRWPLETAGGKKVNS